MSIFGTRLLCIIFYFISRSFNCTRQLNVIINRCNRVVEHVAIHRFTSDTDVDCPLAILDLIWSDGV